MSTTPQRILDQIREAKEKKLKRLYLDSWRQKLTKIPKEIFELDHLEELVLPYHTIRTIPEQIKQLKQLKALDLRGNPLKQITNIKGLILDFEVYQALQAELAPEQISGLKVKLVDMALPPIGLWTR